VEATVKTGAGVSRTVGGSQTRLFGIATYVGRVCLRTGLVDWRGLSAVDVDERNHLEFVLGGLQSYDIGADCPRFAEPLRSP
jgi:hypothetical protein